MVGLRLENLPHLEGCLEASELRGRALTKRVLQRPGVCLAARVQLQEVSKPYLFSIDQLILTETT